MKSLEEVGECREWLKPGEKVSWMLDESAMKFVWILEEREDTALGEQWKHVAVLLDNGDRKTPRMIVEDLKKVRAYARNH